MTASYTTGTVSVQAGNAIVTGVGTGWATSGLVAGQFGLDSANGNPIPVQSIDSDTQITLVKPWRGTNASGQAYWITYDTQPGQQTVSNAQRLAEYIARLDKPTLAALAGLTPAADKIAYFTGPNVAALADFSAAARALLAGGVLPNAQLPGRLRSAVSFVSGSMNNVNENGSYGASDVVTETPYPGFWLIDVIVWPDTTYCVQKAYELFGAQGVYKRHKVNGVWSAWRPAGSVVVGTLSQTGGLQTGAIIERGSTSLGDYVRLADGTQICRGSFTGYTANTNKVVTTAAPFADQRNPVSVNVTPNQVLDFDFCAWADGNNQVNFISTITSTGNRVDYSVTGRWY